MHAQFDEEIILKVLISNTNFLLYTFSDFEMTRFHGITFCIVLLAWFSLSLAENVEVVIEGATSIAKTDENFVCVTMDWWPPEKCDYNRCPWGKSGLFHLVIIYSL